MQSMDWHAYGSTQANAENLCYIARRMTDWRRHLPLRRTMEVELITNMKMARAFRLTVPRTPLVRAGELMKTRLCCGAIG
jgi:hypothetical protein